MISRYCFTTLFAVLTLWAVDAQGQVGNTGFQLNNVYNQTNASRFTTSRLQNQVYRNSLPRASLLPNLSSTNVFSSRNQGGPPQKPFSNINRTSNVSPYFGLVGGNNLTSSINNYYSLVRPQLEQQRINERNRQVQARQQQQLQAVASQPPYVISQDDEIAETGHPVVFNNTLDYYPQRAQR